ncbi:MAG TPA: ABC transporter [Thermotogae bacterium]|nr:type transport system ATP-binding protein [Thermotogota bacterium]HCZ07350.1 ABC transporter [Thermotogota bacterium]
MIEAKGLVKKFGDFMAVRGIDLKVLPGEIYGFLGPNGAGKTTTIRMLTGTLKPSSGEVRILGMRMDESEIEIKRSIGVVPDEPKIYENLKGREFLEFIMDIFKCPRSETLSRLSELCEAFGVDYLDNFAGEYSHGMKQKLMVISVLMRKPRVIFLDEPTVGLDARSAKILKLLLRKYADEGSTIFMTTHVLEVAEKMCDRIGIINEGLLIAEGTLDELRQLSKEGHKNLEDLFLELTGQGKVDEIIQAL